MDDLAKGVGTLKTQEQEELVGKNGEPLMHVKVYSPFKVYLDEPAASISAQNDTGPFDILPRHHNFITLLGPCDLQVRLPYSHMVQKVRISGGIMHVKADRVTVFLNV